MSISGRMALLKDNERADQIEFQREFQRLLVARLKARYGRIPTSAQLARDFSLLAADVAPISNETARKWLRGDVMPHAKRLKILCSWLNIDFGHLGETNTPIPSDRSAEYFLNRLIPLLRLLDVKELEHIHETTIGLLAKSGNTTES